jgi:hypothetical protein
MGASVAWHTAGVWTLLVAPALAEPMPEVSGPVEPVLEWAERDLRRTRLSRAGLLVSTVSPGLVGVGAIAYIDYGTETGGGAAAVALLAVGGAGMLAGPPMLLVGAAGSARALRRQGLEVDRGPARVGAAVYGVALVGSLTTGLGSGSATALGFLGAAYVGEVAFGALQQVTNHRARTRAGWLDVTVAPQLGPSPGLSLAGAF